MLLDIQQVTNYVELGTKIIVLLLMIGSGLWGYNKMYLSKTYVTKTESKEDMQALTKEFKKEMSDIKMEMHDISHRQADMEKDQAIFRQEYKGDMKSIQIVLTQISDGMKDLVHKVNNIPPVKVTDLFDMLFKEKMGGKQ
jgi:rhamnogalacturonyl hydrolase YesR